jgi:hypothetical protein
LPSCPAWPLLSQAGDRQEAELQKSFNDWWEEKYFSNLPFYSQYRELDRIGADLDFVDHLAEKLEYYDLMRAHVVKSGRRKPKADSSLWRDRILFQFAALQGMRHGTVSREKAEEIAEDILEQAKGVNFPRTVTINAEGSDGKLRRKGLIKELAQAVAPAFKDKWRPIMLEYVLTATNTRLGKKPDERGTLILVALTEHLKKKTGRAHHSLAIRTLRALRGQRLGSKSTEGENAKSRVSGFKKQHKDWNNLLKDLER